MKLKSECIPGRPGCVLEGRVTVSEAIEEKLKELEEKTKERRRRRSRS